MRIAQIAPLMESIPPLYYGGTERIVSYITDELVRRGHDVTLFASGDSITKAELVACSDKALRLDPDVQDHVPYHVMLLEKVRKRVADFDIIHFHIDLLHFSLARQIGGHTVTTLHGRLDLPDLKPFYDAFSDIPLVSISNYQRKPLDAHANWVANIYHGLPRDMLGFHRKPSGDYLAFLGRIAPEKRPDRAIEIAVRAGVPLKIAAKIDDVDRVYWNEKIAPLVEKHSSVDYVGEINDEQKEEFLGNARALLFPIDWPEPFGLVMIEAMACGTPVIAFRSGSVPEVIDHGVTGFIVQDKGEAVEATRQVLSLDRAAIRETFERRFSVETMTDQYLETYRSLSESARPMPRSARRY